MQNQFDYCLNYPGTCFMCISVKKKNPYNELVFYLSSNNTHINHVRFVNVCFVFLLIMEWNFICKRLNHLCQRYLGTNLSGKLQAKCWMDLVFIQAAAGYEHAKCQLCQRNCPVMVKRPSYRDCRYLIVSQQQILCENPYIIYI